MQPIKTKNEAVDSNLVRETLSLLFKRRWIIFLTFISIAFSVTLVTLLMPSMYQARSTILIKFGREYIYRPEIGNQTPNLAINQDEIINSEIKILTSQDLIEKVITSMGIKTLYPSLAQSSKMPPIEAAVIAFERKLTVESTKKSNVIEVGFQHNDPKIASQAVNLLVDYYREKHLQVFSGEEGEFLDAQAEAYNAKLRDSETDLENYKQQRQLPSLEDQRNLLLNQRSDLDANLKATRSSIEEQKKRLASLNSQIKGISENKGRYTHTEMDKILVDAKARLLAIQLTEQELLKKYNSDSRQIQDIRDEIRVVKDFLAQEETILQERVKTGSPVYQDAEKEKVRTEADLHSLQAKGKVLQQQLAQLDGEMRRLDASENDLRNLIRNRDVNERRYQLYSDKREEALIVENMNSQKMANVSVIQKANPPSKPVKPKKVLNIGLGFAIGAVMALGLALLAEYSSNYYTTPESIERHLDLPVLVSVPFKVKK